MRYFFVTLLVIPFFVQAQQWRNILIGTYTGSGSHGIYSARVNIKTGAIEIKDSIAAANPSFLAFSPNKKFVYAVVENGKDKQGKVAAFAYDANTAKLTFLNEVLSGGDHPCHIMVHPTGKAVAVANYSGGNFSIIQINDDGSLSDKIKTIQHYGSSIDTIRQKSPHVHQVIFSKTGNQLYVTDLGTDKVNIYGIDNKEGFIAIGEKPMPIISMQKGSGPRHIALSKNENELYVLNELKGSVSIFIKDKNGYLLKQTILVDTISKIPGSAQILLTKNNMYIYTSNRAEANTIGVLKNNEKGATLIQSISTEGIKPRNFVFSPNEKYILVANQVSNTIQVFARGKDGKLELTEKKINIPSPVCLLFE